MYLHQGLVDIYEGIRQYPIVYLPPRPPRISIASLRHPPVWSGGWRAPCAGLPEDHPEGQPPWLPTLLTGLETITDFLEERSLSEPLGEPPNPLPFETFEPALMRGEEPADHWLGRSPQMNTFVRDPVDLEDPRTPKRLTAATSNG